MNMIKIKNRRLSNNLSWLGAVLFLLGTHALLAESVTNLLREAADAYVRQDYKAALDFDNEVIQIETNNWLANIGRGGAYQHLGQFEKAEVDFNKAIVLATNIIPLSYAYLNRGAFYKVITNYDKAIDDFSRAIQINPSFQLAYDYRADVYNSERQFDLSIIDCNMAISLNPDSLSAYCTKGSAFAGKHNYDKAIEAYAKALMLDSNSVWAYSQRAHSYANKEDYLAAIKDFDAVIRLQPTNVWDLAVRGLIKSRIGNYEGGIEDCRKGVRLDTNCFLAYNNLAWLLATAPKSKLRDGHKAVEYATRACELTSWKEPYSLSTLAAAYAEVGNFDEAVKWEKKCILLGLQEKDMGQAHKELNLFEQKKPYHAEK